VHVAARDAAKAARKKSMAARHRALAALHTRVAAVALQAVAAHGIHVATRFVENQSSLLHNDQQNVAPVAAHQHGDRRLDHPERERATRDVGQALGRNPCPIVVPCHRVLAAGNKPGGFSANGGATGWLGTVTAYLGHGTPLFMVLYAALIIFFTFFFNTIVMRSHYNNLFQNFFSWFIFFTVNHDSPIT
jgi:hypothetical protein